MTEEKHQNEDHCDGEELKFNRAAGVILYRRRPDGKIEVPLQLRDDYPAWGQLGVGAMDEKDKYDEQGALREDLDQYKQCAMREVSEECTYPIYENEDRMQFLFGLRGFYAHNGERVEDGAMWAIDIGDFPLEKKGEGAGWGFFVLDEENMPTNMGSYAKAVYRHVMDALDEDGNFRSQPETMENGKQLRLEYHGEYHPFSHLSRDTYSGLSVFNENAKVLARRRNIAAQRAGKDFAAEDVRFGILRWDPQDPGFIANTLLTVAEGQNPDKTLLEILRERQQAPKPGQQ